jgi:MoaD family protein
MLVRLTLLGEARDLAGEPTNEVELPTGATVAAALALLASRYGAAWAHAVRPEDGRIAAEVAVLVNNRNVYLADGLATRLTEGDALAIMPVISGG